MSSLVVLDRVAALCQKAQELVLKGHFMRAAENFGLAAEAANALGEDNIVAVHMMLQRGNALGAYAMTAAERGIDPRTLATYRAENVTSFSSGVKALERRRAAGTLLAGKCAAVEEQWYFREFVQRINNACLADADLSSKGALVGYDEYLRSAAGVTKPLKAATLFANECSYAQLLSFTEHIVHAAELMQQPQRRGGVTLEHEAWFARALCDTVEAGVETGLDASLVKQLTDAWQQLQRSGVLQERNLEERMWLESPAFKDYKQRCMNAIMAPGLRHCALSSCGVKEAHPQHFKACAACRRVVYCCKEHQSQDWPAHKAACKAARKAKAESQQAGPSGA